MKFLVIGLLVLFGWISLAPGISRATVESRKEELRERMDSLKERIDTHSQEIKDARQREMSLEEEIEMYDKKIEKLKLQIESLDMSIQETSEGIETRGERLDEIEVSIDREKEILQEYIQATWQKEGFSAIEIVFGNDDLSYFVDQLKQISQFRQAMLTSLEEIRTEREALAEEKEQLRDKRAELYDMKGLQEAQKKTLARQKEKQNILLAEARETRNVFMSMVDDSRSELEKVKAELYELEDLGVSMKLKDAIEDAKYVSAKTGVKPALLLAILEHESDMGNNLGSGNWREDMHPGQHGAFLEICKKAGRDPDNTPVSRKPYYSWGSGGWGGAMGPAQFMPKTWMGYEAEIEKLTGDSPVSPYNFKHALMALGIKLKKAGADASTYQGEFNAVMQFFSGHSWSWHEERAYGDPVMNELVPKYQRKLEILEQG